MNIIVKKMKELPDGSAICTLDISSETKEYLIGEGFLAVLKRSLDTSESAVKPEMLEETKDVEL
jgi:hypothetical protein